MYIHISDICTAIHRATSVCPGNSCRDPGSQLQSDSGKRSKGRRGRMETESPQGLNLHPAKQPRTTLFDWLPAGLPSVPTWTNLHGSLRVSLFPSRRRRLIFFISSFSFSLVILFLRVYPFPPVPLSLIDRPPRSPLDRFPVGIINGDGREKRTFIHLGTISGQLGIFSSILIRKTVRKTGRY